MSDPDEDWLVDAAGATQLDPWDCVREHPDEPCVRPGHNLLPCQWKNPAEWPW
ncbi:hypothetical protein ACIBTV_27140 [Micromonospora sp. NPDC049366]|uniref:hypothetical protein n=1 Tax=Micromonospora sp. NPDC049366 TaxID=3364271 RepID=UPI00379C5105